MSLFLILLPNVTVPFFECSVEGKWVVRVGVVVIVSVRRGHNPVRWGQTGKVWEAAAIPPAEESVSALDAS